MGVEVRFDRKRVFTSSPNSRTLSRRVSPPSRVDYVDRRATLGLNVWVGNLDAATDAEREAYRPVNVIISGLLWCIIEAPETTDYARVDGLWIDSGPVSSLKNKPAVPTVPDDAFAWWIFVREWNAFIYIAGTDASFDL